MTIDNTDYQKVYVYLGQPLGKTYNVWLMKGEVKNPCLRKIRGHLNFSYRFLSGFDKISIKRTLDGLDSGLDSITKLTRNNNKTKLNLSLN